MFAFATVLALWVSVECNTTAANSSFNISCKELTINTTEATLPGPRISKAIMSILVIAFLLLPTFFYYIFCIRFDFDTAGQKEYNSTSQVEKKDAMCGNPLDVQPIGKQDESIVQDDNILFNDLNYLDHELMHYSIILRVGCPSLLFDMQNGWMEFILVDKNHNDVNVNSR